MISEKAWFFSMLFLFLCFYSKPCEAAKGKELVIRYQIEKIEKVNPSYCMAICLETLDGSYVKTLYASPDYTDELVMG